MKAIAWIVFLTFIGVSAFANFMHGADRLGGALMAVVPIGFAAVIFLVEALVAQGRGSRPLYTAAAVVGGGAGIASYIGLATMALDHKVPALVAYLLPLAYDGVVMVASLAIRGLGPDRHGLDQTAVDQTRSTPVDHVDQKLDQSVDHPVDHPVQAPWTTVDQTVDRAVDHSAVQPVDQPWSAGQSPVHGVDHPVDQTVDHPAGPAVDHVDQKAWTTVDQTVDRAVDHGGPAVDHSVDRVDQTAVDHVVQWTDLTDKEKADRTTKAVQEVLDGKSINGAAKANGVPKSTLIRKVKDAQTPVVVTDAKPELKAIEAVGVDLDAELAELLGNDKTKEA